MTQDSGLVTARQQRMWATGDFHRIGVSQLVVGELLVRALHVHGGEAVLDIAGGAGNTALAAARRWARVTCTDYLPALLDHAAARARCEGLPLRTQVADAQDLPFPDGSFDVVTSTFGVMFVPDQQRAAAELVRVLKPGGRLGMANWTPDSWVTAQLALQARYNPPPAGLAAPAAWGTVDRLPELFADRVVSLETSRQHVDFTHHDTHQLFELFKAWFGPVATVWVALGEPSRAEFATAWIALADQFNIADDGTCEIPSTYLQVTAVKA
ncbi:MAG TPA: class I SAM-dependent methyltransferase [Pseudonocardiaceae bacterium]